MEYVRTEHARDVLEKQGIQTAWLEQALSTPDATEADPVDPDLEHRRARIPGFGGRV